MPRANRYFAYEDVFDAENRHLRQKMPTFGTYIVEYQIVARVRPEQYNTAILILFRRI
jgi:hypothetical protein